MQLLHTIKKTIDKGGAQSGLLVNVMFRGADDGFVTHRSWPLGPEVIITKLSGIV